METIILGLLALTLLIVSIYCLYYKKLILGLVCSVATMALTCLTGYFWKEMLIGSGKDTTLLGFNRYPVAVIILVILMITALAVLIISIICMTKKNKEV